MYRLTVRLISLTAACSALALPISASADEPTPTPNPTPTIHIAVDNFLIDMDPGSTPANTATSIGSTEPCARINENDVMDADEDGVDVLDIDIVAGPVGFPPDHPLIAFEFELQYPIGISVIERNLSLLLSEGGNSNIFKAFVDPVPDSDGRFHAAALDLNVNTPENQGHTGPGPLARLRLRSLPGFPSRVGELRLVNTPHDVPGIYAADLQNDTIMSANMVDANGDTVPDSVAQVAQLAFNTPCPAEPAPSITPGPLRTPTPTPRRTPAPSPTTTSAATPDPTPSPAPSSAPTPSVTPGAFPPTGGPQSGGPDTLTLLLLAASAAAIPALALTLRLVRR